MAMSNMQCGAISVVTSCLANTRVRPQERIVELQQPDDRVVQKSDPVASQIGSSTPDPHDPECTRRIVTIQKKLKQY